MTDSPQTALADVKTSDEPRHARLTGVAGATFDDFGREFLRLLASPDFGEKPYAVMGKQKGAAAKEIARAGIVAMLSRGTFLRSSHRALKEHVRLVKEQDNVRRAAHDAGKKIKRLRDAQQTVATLQRKIRALDQNLSEIVAESVRQHFDNAHRQLEQASCRLLGVEKHFGSSVHPEERGKHDKNASGKNKYKLGWKPLLRPFDYDLDTLRKKAPEQWLFETLNVKLKHIFRRASTTVSDITRYKIIAAVMGSGGLGAVNPEKIKEYFIEKNKAHKASARKMQPA